MRQAPTSQMALLSSLLSMGIWPPLLALFAVYNIYLFIYRRYFHSLSHIPGPFLNSFSYLPYLYYQGILEGQLMHVLPKWHEKYGSHHRSSSLFNIDSISQN